MSIGRDEARKLIVKYKLEAKDNKELLALLDRAEVETKIATLADQKTADDAFAAALNPANPKANVQTNMQKLDLLPTPDTNDKLKACFIENQVLFFSKLAANFEKPLDAEAKTLIGPPVDPGLEAAIIKEADTPTAMHKAFQTLFDPEKKITDVKKAIETLDIKKYKDSSGSGKVDQKMLNDIFVDNQMAKLKALAKKLNRENDVDVIALFDKTKDEYTQLRKAILEKEGVLNRDKDPKKIHEAFEKMLDPTVNPRNLSSHRATLGFHKSYMSTGGWVAYGYDAKDEEMFVRNQVHHLKSLAAKAGRENDPAVKELLGDMGDPKEYKQLRAEIIRKRENPTEISALFEELLHPKTNVNRISAIRTALGFHRGWVLSGARYGHYPDDEKIFIQNQLFALHKLAADSTDSDQIATTKALFGDPPDFKKTFNNNVVVKKLPTLSPTQIEQQFKTMLDTKAADAKRNTALVSLGFAPDDVGILKKVGATILSTVSMGALGSTEPTDEQKALFLEFMTNKLKAIKFDPPRDEEVKDLLDKTDIKTSIKDRTKEGAQIENHFKDLFDPVKTHNEIKTALTGLAGTAVAAASAAFIAQQFKYNQIARLIKTANDYDPPRHIELKSILGDGPPNYAHTSANLTTFIQNNHANPAAILTAFNNMVDPNKSLVDVAAARRALLGILPPTPLTPEPEAKEQFARNQIAGLIKNCKAPDGSSRRDEAKTLFNPVDLGVLLEHKDMKAYNITQLQTKFDSLFDKTKNFTQHNLIGSAFGITGDNLRQQFAKNQYDNLRDLIKSSRYKDLDSSILAVLNNDSNKPAIISAIDQHYQSARSPTYLVDKLLDGVLHARGPAALTTALKAIIPERLHPTINIESAVTVSRASAQVSTKGKSFTDLGERDSFTNTNKNYKRSLNLLDHIERQADTFLSLDKDKKLEEKAKLYQTNVDEIKVQLTLYSNELQNVIDGKASMFGRSITSDEAKERLKTITKYTRESPPTSGVIENINKNLDLFLKSSYTKASIAVPQLEVVPGTKQIYEGTSVTDTEQKATTWIQAQGGPNQPPAPAIRGFGVIGHNPNPGSSLTKLANPDAKSYWKSDVVKANDKGDTLALATSIVRDDKNRTAVATGLFNAQQLNDILKNVGKFGFSKGVKKIKDRGVDGREYEIPPLCVMKLAESFVEALRDSAPPGMRDEVITLEKNKEWPDTFIEAILIYSKLRGYDCELSKDTQKTYKGMPPSAITRDGAASVFEKVLQKENVALVSAEEETKPEIAKNTR